MKNSRELQINRLHRLKQLKSEIALAKVSRLKSECIKTEQDLARAHEDLIQTVDGADGARMDRLKTLFQSTTAHGSLQHLAVGTWLKTENEIDQARVDLAEKESQLEHIQKRLNLAQEELAHKMRSEAKAEKLCAIETEMMQHTELRRS